MKKILTIFTILSFVFANAQYHKGTVYFKDHETYKGLIKIKTFEGIKFKSTENGEVKEYNHEQLNGYDVKGWQYRYVKGSNSETPKLLKLILEGKISLYSDVKYNVGSVNSVNSLGFPIGAGNLTVYYISANNGLKAIGTKFKKRDLEIFKDCTKLIEKIQKKEFKKWDVYDIVEFYNEDCNQ